MLIPNHPDDERLSALASRDTDATADASLTAHVSSCVRCTALVDELGALRAALAELPDLRPHPAPPAPAAGRADRRAVDRLGGWARRFFAPVLAAGAALALVGVVGTAAPALSWADFARAPRRVRSLATSAATERGATATEPRAPSTRRVQRLERRHRQLRGSHRRRSRQRGRPRRQSDGRPSRVPTGDAEDRPTSDGDRIATALRRHRRTPQRSPWPMVLFAGVALMIAAGAPALDPGAARRLIAAPQRAEAAARRSRAPGSSTSDQRRHEQRRPAGVPEGRSAAARPRRATRARDRDLAGLTHRPGRGARLGRGGAPGCPGARRRSVTTGRIGAREAAQWPPRRRAGRRVRAVVLARGAPDSRGWPTPR